MILKDQDVLGFRVGNGEICRVCILPTEIENIPEDKVVTVYQTDISGKDFYFCDRCKRKFSAESLPKLKKRN